MTSINDLLPDIWLMIVEYLKLIDLANLHDAFDPCSWKANIRAISSTQAEKLLFRLLTTGLTLIQVDIKSDAQHNLTHVEWSQKPRHTRGRKQDFLSPSLLNFPSTFESTTAKYAPISASKTKMTLSTPFLCDSAAIFLPNIFGGDPMEPFTATIYLRSKSVDSLAETEGLELFFSTENEKGNNIVQDSHQIPTTLTRVIEQDLYLRGGTVPRTQLLLPMSWFRWLGNCIHVSCMLDKTVPVTSPEKLQSEPFILRKMIVSFDFTLPTSKSLLRLLPVEAISRGFSIGDESNPDCTILSVKWGMVKHIMHDRIIYVMYPCDIVFIVCITSCSIWQQSLALPTTDHGTSKGICTLVSSHSSTRDLGMEQVYLDSRPRTPRKFDLQTSFLQYVYILTCLEKSLRYIVKCIPYISISVNVEAIKSLISWVTTYTF